MIYDAIALVAASLVTNFANDLQAIAAAKGQGAIDHSINVYPHRAAEIFTAVKTDALPGLGVYSLTARTQAKSQGSRDSRPTIVFDYFARGADPALLTTQCELAAEAILKTIDRVAPTNTTDQLIGAGEDENSVTVSIQGTSQAEGSKLFEDRVLVTCPVTFRDTGL